MSRAACMAAALAAVVATVAPAATEMPPLLLWNASASAPLGLYAIRKMAVPTAGALAVIAPPDKVARFAATRGYLPLGVPMLKHIEGLPGSQVCRLGRVITVNGLAVGAALERDRKGRALPDWQGCRVIAAAEIFVMNPRVEDSLDGRYFGAFPASSIVGGALWLRAYDWTTDQGAAALNDYARANDPFSRVGKQQVAVDISSVIRASPGSFRAAWIERHYENGQLSGTERWTAILTIVTQMPNDAERLRANPLGIYVNAINWSREMSQ